MGKLLTEQPAGRILGQGSPALLDRSIYDPQVLFDDRDGRRIETGSPLAHDLLQHLDLSVVYRVGVRLIGGSELRGGALPPVWCFTGRKALGRRRLDSSGATSHRDLRPGRIRLGVGIRRCIRAGMWRRSI